MLFSFLFKWDKNSFLSFNLLMEDWAEIKGIIISHRSIHKNSRISFLSDCKSKTFPLSLNSEYLGIKMFSSPRQLLFVHCPHVNSEIASLNTPVWTIRTLEWLLSRVSQLMIFQLKSRFDNNHKFIIWKFKNFIVDLCVLNQLSTIFTVNPLELLACVGGLMLLHVLGRVEDLTTIWTGILLPKLVKICIKPIFHKNQR